MAGEEFARDADMHGTGPGTEAMIRAVLALAEQRLTLDPVPLDGGPVSPEALEAVLGGLIGAHGSDPVKVLDLYQNTVAPAVISTDSPRFLGFIPAAPTKAALLFDMLVSCASIQGISWLEAAGAVHAENQVLRLLAEAAGMPAGAGGTFVSGGSAGNLSALAVARERAKARLREESRTGPARPRLRVAVSREAHSSIMHTLTLLELEPLVVPGEDHRLTGAALRAAIERDDDPASVIAVVATCGTTNAGILDDLAGVAEVAREHDWWFHVDGAYGGAAVLAPSVRPRLAGIEHADSLIIDPHKWLFTPFDCGALLYARPQLARAVHAQDAAYLDVIHDRPQEWNPTDYAYHLTRRARGLPLWFSLAVHGTAAYAEAIEAGIRLARLAADEIRARPQLELIREPELSVVLFRRLGWTAADYTAWAGALHAEQIAFLPPSSWEGEVVGRLAFLHPHTSPDLVRQILDRTA